MGYCVMLLLSLLEGDGQKSFRCTILHISERVCYLLANIGGQDDLSSQPRRSKAGEHCRLPKGLAEFVKEKHQPGAQTLVVVMWGKVHA